MRPRERKLRPSTSSTCRWRTGLQSQQAGPRLPPTPCCSLRGRMREPPDQGRRPSGQRELPAAPSEPLPRHTGRCWSQDGRRGCASSSAAPVETPRPRLLLGLLPWRPQAPPPEAALPEPQPKSRGLSEPFSDFTERQERLFFRRTLGPPGRAQQERPQPPTSSVPPAPPALGSPLRSGPSPEDPSERIRKNGFLLQGGHGHAWCVPSGFFCFGFSFIFLKEKHFLHTKFSYCNSWKSFRSQRIFVC